MIEWLHKQEIGLTKGQAVKRFLYFRRRDNMERKQGMGKGYIAHIRESGEIQTVKEHSENTAKLCRGFAVEELKDLAYAMGLLHDAGKYQSSFQKRINGEHIRIEHSICGAKAAEEVYAEKGNIAASLMLEYCIAGHHGGLPNGGNWTKDGHDTPDMPTLSGRMRRKTEDFNAYQEELELPQVDANKVLQFLTQDCENKEMLIERFAFMTRYAYSCLVDADTIDTAEFCSGETRRSLRADFPACLKKAEERLASFICETPLQKARGKLQAQAFQNAEKDAEIYLLNMPTGSGKTLASIKIALERAIKTGKRRIIYVIPYNGIIDQTVREFECLFGQSAELLRHQSTFSYDEEDEQDKEDEKRKEKDASLDESDDFKKAAKNAVENWNADSIIVTTAVQFFESLYANKRGKLRKLHNIANSILVFDEAHLLPVKFLKPCLQAIAYTTKYLNSEAIFLTATMPDFPRFLKQYALKNSRVLSLIEDKTLFSAFQKCRYEYIGEQEYEDLIGKAVKCPSALLIANSRKAVRKLYALCRGKCYHLSTYMTPLDRGKKLEEIRRELKQLELDFPDGNVPEDRRIIITATSLIEAGVDIDVHTVFRELTGLDSILQAGGRCNREGKRKEATVYIFSLPDKRISADEKGNLTQGLLKEYQKDIASPECVTKYYDRLYFMHGSEIEKETISCECGKIEAIPFRDYADKFRFIDSPNVGVVVPRDEESETYIRALRYAENTMGIGRKLQKYTCTVTPKEFEELQKQHVLEDYETGIWCLTNPDYYDEETGITFEAKDYFL